MYVITLGQRAETRTTLAGVLHLLNDDRSETAQSRFEEIAVRHVEGGNIPVVCLSHGRLGVRPGGSARSILTRVIDEVDRFIVRVGGKVLHPQEMSRASWGAVLAAGRLAYFPEEAIDLSQGAAGPLFRTADLFEESGPFDIAQYVQSEFVRRFGYGTNGPLYDPAQIPNARHEVHVAYALLRGEKLRECVLNTYRDNPRFGRSDLDWLEPLIAVPALRGALSAHHLQTLCRLLRLEKIAITPQNAPKLLAIVRRVPADGTDVHMDDALYEAGVLAPRSTLVARPAEGQAAAPVSALASRIHHLITQRQFHATMDKAKAQREALEISQRHFDDIARRAVHARVSTSFDWPNKVALAVLQRDVATLLHIFDNPKDWNVDSKRALREELDVDLLQCTAAVRRQRIFEMCGFSAAEQQRWEQQAVAAKASRLALQDFEDARKRAEASNWRLESGKVLNGREYVDFCIAEGFSEIVDVPPGRAREYRIRDPHRSMSRRQRAKDGTLAYARAKLAQAGTPRALAA
ncbi:hypothetical protein [Cupriavidus sp. BIC8F]|uniref:hypothetical protein n=1 Tax=Cupriavidus sp. BIC8F TaxID=3079014 RepID=UPI0029163238|nr:hypothetical protein [Cupriavidus sp. BIC8F]